RDAGHGASSEQARARRQHSWCEEEGRIWPVGASCCCRKGQRDTWQQPVPCSVGPCEWLLKGGTFGNCSARRRSRSLGWDDWAASARRTRGATGSCDPDRPTTRRRGLRTPPVPSTFPPKVGPMR
ncbi:unnamed protein product, partial [Hapterophycus canaliculatus]